eukprot:SAG11_NODE_17631_length_513_cov_0.869565_1_plen_48_part_01
MLDEHKISSEELIRSTNSAREEQQQKLEGRVVETLAGLHGLHVIAEEF